MDKIIKIGGAGISGLTAAINLAKAGYKVEVFDMTKDSGIRFNNDFQGIENWSYEQDALDFLKDINIELNFYYWGSNKLSLWAPDGCHRDFKLPRSAYYLVRRGTVEDSLDQGLKKQALAFGVKIFYNHPIKSKDVDIMATGPVLNDPNKDALVSGYAFKTDLEDCHIGLLDDSCALNGYSYFFVHDGQATLATCIFGNYRELDKYIEKTLEIFKQYKNFKMEDVKKFVGTGNFFLPKIPKSRKVYIGEAGGFQDYLFGFGMRYAMKSGYYAARSIIEGRDFYELCQKDLIPRMKASVVNRLFFMAFGKRAYKWFIKHCSDRDPVKFTRQSYRYQSFKKILFPVAAIILRKNIRDPRNS
ncbi:NAD(P)-binding protein [Patescibacteria group bacterium]|nr:NAD(P)-binding protein [Patescibacteria group bacterium]MBU4274631.1 NAD(P)-binding protein [Patescibacteria group bacterium]MBU4367677.1 NAD(P)-binding protein [Patescibacteria group bacterium]MBU4461873.1 NAD(P)-binding protein [Patescibacteria group bacterium]MCG2699996.1 NAD(P)-binding protein [Candidatus Parcubacteria bacterium]